MSNQQDIFYVVRVGVDGTKELVQFTGDVKKLNEESDKGGKVIGKYDEKLKSFSNTLDDTKGKTDRLNKSHSSANNLLLELTRGASDAQYGIRGLGNNLEQAAYISTLAYKEFGSVNGVLAGMKASLLGPGGLIVGVTALTIALPLAGKFISNLGKDSKDFTADSEELVKQLQTINRELAKLKGLDNGSFFSSESDYDAIRRLSVLEEDIKARIREMNIAQAEQASSNPYGGYVPYNTEEIRQAQADLEAVSEEIEQLQKSIERTERLKSYPEALAAEWERAKAATEEYNKAFQEEFDNFSFDVDPLAASDTSALEKQLDDDAKARAAYFNDQAQAQQKFNNYLAQMQVTVARSSGDELAAIEAERQRRIEEIRNNELITEQQRKDALVLINEDAENRITAYKEQQEEIRTQKAKEETEERKMLERQLRDLQLSFAENVTSSLVGFGAVLVGESEKNAKARFEWDKAFNYASAITNTAAGVTKALATLPPPASYWAAASTGIAGGIQVAKIAATTFQGSGTGASASSYNYRSGNGDQPVFTTPTGSNSNTRSNSQENSGETRNTGRTKVVYLDNLGNFVARGLEEMDASGGSNYVRGSL